MNTLKVISVAWLITWGFMYVFAAISAPGISGDASQGIVLYSLVSIATIIGVILTVAAERKRDSLMKNSASAIMLILFIIEVYSALASWTGLVKWNVPFQNIGLPGNDESQRLHKCNVSTDSSCPLDSSFSMLQRLDRKENRWALQKRSE